MGWNGSSEEPAGPSVVHKLTINVIQRSYALIMHISVTHTVLYECWFCTGILSQAQT